MVALGLGLDHGEERMRKLVVCGLMAVIGAASAAVALGASQATIFSVKQSARAEGASTGIAFKITFADSAAPNALPSGLKSFKIKLHKGSKIDARAATQCKVSSEALMSKGAGACPASSRIGKGTATATSAAGASVTVDAVIFNERVGGRDAFLFVFLINDSFVTAFDAHVKGATISSEGLTGTIPGDLVVTKFNGTIGKHSKGRGNSRHDLITTPSVCPPGTRKWTNTGTFIFQNANTDTASSTSACKPGP
jgi:hypothetical protein